MHGCVPVFRICHVVLLMYDLKWCMTNKGSAQGWRSSHRHLALLHVCVSGVCNEKCHRPELPYGSRRWYTH